MKYLIYNLNNKTRISREDGRLDEHTGTFCCPEEAITYCKRIFSPDQWQYVPDHPERKVVPISEVIIQDHIRKRYGKPNSSPSGVSKNNKR